MKLRKRCFYCQKLGKGKRCPTCKTIRYCNSECQLADWEIEHKYICGATLGMKPEYEFHPSNTNSLHAVDFFKEYKGLDYSEMQNLADSGDIEAEICLDGLFGLKAMNESAKIIPGEALQALTRSSDRGCPLSQMNLALYLQRDNPHDRTALSLLEEAAKAGLCAAHFELGILPFSHISRKIS
jgi:hypothetical protein